MGRKEFFEEELSNLSRHRSDWICVVVTSIQKGQKLIVASRRKDENRSPVWIIQQPFEEAAFATSFGKVGEIRCKILEGSDASRTLDLYLRCEPNVAWIEPG
ncbi:hypothetical protein [Mesorhizobium sp.]|uniref:hypothetical protein n=1 Tax=Mesorhizobium sp. TaxID=1871066 RepID=UPI0011F40CB4|nr:hypothetical protein [Mesorhizobium sp.]TIQ27144.1 MAG: hypothetical protein E5X54_22680 [Mesorhizobium sp.]